jgi:nucleoside phosphorylase
METQTRALSYEEYYVGIVCALAFEVSAVRYMLDVEHDRLPAKEGDANVYVLGELFGHNVALTCLPGNKGKGSAAAVATNMSRSFPQIRYRLLVGIGGGVPSEAHDIRLGDVVVSMPDGQYGGVVQYDLGSDLENGFTVTGFLHHPPTVLRSAAQIMRSSQLTRPSMIQKHLTDFMQRDPSLNVYTRPPPDSDVLFDSDYCHDVPQPTCFGCDRDRVIRRKPRTSTNPKVHYGLIASGDRVIKSGSKRSTLIREIGNILCFEMEAAGLLAELPCIVIRGISDYADSHKNDNWQHYAAAAAAACAKELLSYLDVEVVSPFRIRNALFPDTNYQIPLRAIGHGRVVPSGPLGDSKWTFGMEDEQWFMRIPANKSSRTFP